MVQLSATVDADALAKLEAHLIKIRDTAPQKLGVEVRRAAINICRSLRRATPAAPRKKPDSEYYLEPYNVHPKYIHAKDGRLMRRFLYVSKRGTPAEKTQQIFVYTSRHPGPRGRMVGGGDDRRRALNGTPPGTGLGYIKNRELAKRSWGWAMHELYRSAGTSDLRWKPYKKNRRNPRAAIKGLFRSFVTGPDSGAYAEIVNRLDYVRDILPDSVINDAFSKAVNRLVTSAEKIPTP